MSTILLSIRPEYADKILDGTKKYEYRKHLAQEGIHKILIYSTSPRKKVVGEVKVTGTLTMKKTLLWEYTKKYAGISRIKYAEYFKGCQLAHAYCLGDIIKYYEPKNIQDYGLKKAPQSFVYINEE